MLILSLVYPGFTTLDLIGALQPLAQVPGSKTEIVAAQSGANPTDSGAAIMADATYETASRSPDVILVPGGGTPSIDILEDRATVDFLARQANQPHGLSLSAPARYCSAKPDCCRGTRPPVTGR